MLRRHRADDTVSKAITRVLRADLAVVDDIGLLPVAQDAAKGLHRLVDAAYEKRSIATSVKRDDWSNTVISNSMRPPGATATTSSNGPTAAQPTPPT